MHWIELSEEGGVTFLNLAAVASVRLRQVSRAGEPLATRMEICLHDGREIWTTDRSSWEALVGQLLALSHGAEQSLPALPPRREPAL